MGHGISLHGFHFSVSINMRKYVKVYAHFVHMEDFLKDVYIVDHIINEHSSSFTRIVDIRLSRGQSFSFYAPDRILEKKV